MPDPYYKSRELGFDYLNDRIIDDDEYITFNIDLDDIPFDFDVYMKQCAKAFYDFQKNKYNFFMDAYGYEDCRFVTDKGHCVRFIIYETEANFIKRKELELENERKKREQLEKLEKQKIRRQKKLQDQKIKDAFELCKSLSLYQKKKLLKELL